MYDREIMGRTYPRVHRLLRLISVIQSDRKLRVSDLARLCETHVRTVYRDLSTLRASGIPCDLDADTGGYRVRAGYFMPPVELTFEEAMAIVALLEQVGGHDQIAFLGVAARAAEKIRSQLPPALVDALDPLDGHVHVDLARGMSDGSPRDVYDTVRQAIARRRLLHCTYEAVRAEGAGLDRPFELRPYALWYCQRAWYVVGHHSDRSATRRLKLNRFTSITPTDRPFAIPDDFDLRADLGNAWRMIRGKTRYNVAICFDPDFSDAASETRWHPTQQEEWDGDSVTLRFAVDGLDEIVWWVLGYGPGATVLEPAELIQRVKQLASATAAKYTKKKKRKSD